MAEAAPPPPLPSANGAAAPPPDAPADAPAAAAPAPDAPAPPAADAPMPDAAAPAPAAPGPRVRLRLDSCCVLARAVSAGETGDGVVLVPQEKAAALGWLTDDAVAALERLVAEAAKRAPPPPPGAAARRLGDPRASLGPARPPSAAAASMPPPSADWRARAAAVLAAVRAALGPNAWIFDTPVDRAAVPDYYNVITTPVDLTMIAGKLEGGEYADATAFLADMRLVWTNCATYNHPDSEVGRLGARIESAFERAATGAGFALAPRAKRPRATAGVARPRYDPPPPPSRSGGGAAARSGGGGGRLARTASRGGGAASSGDRGGGGGGPPPATRPRRAAASAPRVRPMPFERMQAIGEALGSLDGDALNGALDIVRHALGDEAGGEVELDFDAIGPEALWRLDAYLASLGIATGPPVADPMSESEESESE